MTLTPLTPRQRLARGLKYTAVGPVDVTRGVLGVGVDSAQATAAELRRRYQSGQLRRELAAARRPSSRSSWPPRRRSAVFPRPSRVPAPATGAVSAC